LPAELDACVLDPPRAGAADVLPALLSRRCERIVYVSCDTATFARDVRSILAGGYEFSSLRLVDLTPQTYRAEVLGVFQLTW
jgi:23S rRNA (uracil1939-C5)-methyltransferase